MYALQILDRSSFSEIDCYHAKQMLQSLFRSYILDYVFIRVFNNETIIHSLFYLLGRPLYIPSHCV